MNHDDLSRLSMQLDRRRFLSGLGAVTAAGLLAACGRGDSAGNATAGASNSSAPTKMLTIGSIVPTLDAQFWQRYKGFTETTAKGLGIELITVNANNSADKLSRGVDDLVARKVDGLIFVPYFGAGPKGIAATDAAGIVSMCVDTTPEDIVPGGDFPNYIGFVGPDDETAGLQMADALSKTITPGPDGKKKIVALQGTPGTSVAINRYKGLERYIAEGGDLTLLGKAVGNFVAGDSQKAMDDLLQRNPDLQGVWCANGGTATGAIAALKNAGKKAGADVKVVTMDLNPDNVELVKSGEIEFDTGGHWLQGGFSLIIMHDWLNDKKIAEDKRSQIIKLLPVTKATLGQLAADYPDGQPTYDIKEHSRVYTPSGPDAVVELKYSKPVELKLAP